LQAVGERPAPSTSLCTSRNGMLIWAYACALQGVEPGKPAFLPRLWCVDLLLDKGEFAEAAAQAKLQHWAAAYQEAQTRRY
jgi:hypothetical protein